MGLVSAGVYLKVIRERRNFSRAELAQQMKVSVQTIANIEKGDKEPGSTLLFAFINFINAKVEDVAHLILSQENESEARVRAEQAILTEAQQAKILQFRSKASGDVAANWARKVADNPELRLAFIQVVDAMRDLEDAEPKE